MIWPFRKRSSCKSPVLRCRRLDFEILEDRNLLSGDLLLVGLDVSTGSSKFSLLQYTQSGTLVRSTPIPDTPDPSDFQYARGLTVDSSGNAEIYNGTFNPYLTTYTPSSQTWSFRDFAGWSTVNNGSYGGVAAFKNFVFATDMAVANDSTNGIIRFDNSGGQTLRFASGNDFIDITMGLDGFLYALGASAGVSVFDPNTLSLVRSFGLTGAVADVRSIAVDAAGNLFVGEYSADTVVKLDPSGTNVLATKQFISPAGHPDGWRIGLDRDGQVVVGGGTGTVYLTDESFSSVITFSTGKSFTFATFDHYIPGPSTSPAAVQENFVVQNDNQVFGQKFDALGNPSGKPYLVANGSLQSVVSGRDVAGNLVLFGIDPYLNHVWELKFDSGGNPLSSFYTPVWVGGAVGSIAVGHNGVKNLELFAVDPFIHHVWGMKFNANSDPTDSFTLLSKGGVATTLTVGHDGIGNPLLFTIDPYFSQVQEMKLNSGGNPVSDFYRPGSSFAVKQIALGTDGHGNPELFAVDPYFGHVFYLNFDANANATIPFFLQASPGAIAKSIAVGNDLNNDPEVLTLGPNFQAYALRFDNNGKPVGDSFYTGQTVVSVTSIQIGFASNGLQELFGFGLGDNQIYQESFDGNGNPIRTWFLDALGTVKALAASV
jgi:hypothetical protein